MSPAGSGDRRRRVLVVANPHATTVSYRLKNLVLHALGSQYEVEAIDTEGRNHATALCRAAAGEGFDLVIAFGGDGTVNEAANGLAGGSVPLAVLPGGCTNVSCRILGVPNDIVAATERLLAAGNELPVRAIDLGCVNGRLFLIGSGIGFDADAMRRADRAPQWKARAGRFYYAQTLIRALYASGGGQQRLLRVESGGEGPAIEAAALVVQNAAPYAYLGKRRLDVCEGTALDSGTLSYCALRVTRRRDIPGLAWRLLGPGRVSAHPRVSCAEGVAGLEARAIGPDFPLHVDGDYIGHFSAATYAARPAVLRVVV